MTPDEHMLIAGETRLTFYELDCFFILSDSCTEGSRASAVSLPPDFEVSKGR